MTSFSSSSSAGGAAPRVPKAASTAGSPRLLFGHCVPEAARPACCSSLAATSVGGDGVSCEDTDGQTPPESSFGSGRLPRALLSFDASMDQPVEGRLLRQGSLLMLDGADNAMKPWTVLLFSNGFYAVSQSGAGREPEERGPGMHSFAWSPFAEVRELAADPEDRSCPFRTTSAFALYLFGQNMGFVFATWGKSASKERQLWVSAMAEALHTFTHSLFPPFAISAFPLPEAPSTRTRILAGYLLRGHSGGAVSVPYCELHAHCHHSALFAMYEEESCERLDGSLVMTALTRIGDPRGSSCPCFVLDTLDFCARTVREKQLWLRALQNVKVKLDNEAPDPSSEDLLHWRHSVLESASRSAPAGAAETDPPGTPAASHRTVQAAAAVSPHLSWSSTPPSSLPSRGGHAHHQRGGGSPLNAFPSAHQQPHPRARRPSPGPRRHCQEVHAAPAERPAAAAWRGAAAAAIQQQPRRPTEGSSPLSQSGAPSLDFDCEEVAGLLESDLPTLRVAAYRTTSRQMLQHADAPD